jgi:two-component system, chemotaxis family, protein-glutamate methylesterase/glutaminase
MRRNIITIGASAGGVGVLQTFVSGLRGDFPAAIFVVLHTAATSPGLLPEILSRAGSLPAAYPEDGDSISEGRIYVAPPDCHLFLRGTTVSVIRGPRENCSRPAIDPLFRSAAFHHGQRVIGIILSGTMDDGSVGLRDIKECGGIAIVQDPSEAPYPDMIENAQRAVGSVDYCVSVDAMPELLRTLAETDITPQPSTGSCERLRLETGMAAGEIDGKDGVARLGEVSSFVCPECGGALWEMKEERILRYRCHIGHAYSGASLVGDQSASLDRALGIALRSLEDTVSLAKRMAERARLAGRKHAEKVFATRAIDAAEKAEVIRALLQGKRFPQR